MSKKIQKKADVAGLFYPSTKKELSQMLEYFMDQAKDINLSALGLIVPHAGYIYSGQIAAAAYKILAKQKNNYQNIFIFGPAHRAYFTGCAIHSAEEFVTPLGPISQNMEIRKELVNNRLVKEKDLAYSGEHSLEVQIPFIQNIFADQVKIIPILVGDAVAEDVAKIIELYKDPKNFFIISSDLSHFHNEAEQHEIDNDTIIAIESKDVNRVKSDKACGSRAIKGLIKYANDANLKIEKISSGNSASSSGDTSQVVGYASFILRS
jgi:MEMO1 family protein